MAAIAEQAREFGIEPIPSQARTLGFFDTFVLWADLGLSFLVMVVGMFLVPGLGLGQALAAILVGALIGNFLLGLILLIGSVFVPLLGMLTADYFGLRGRSYDLTELYRTGGHYWYHGGVNWLAMAIWLLGFILYLLIAGLPQLGLPGLAPWLGATLPSFGFGFVAYLLVSQLIVQRSAVR